MHHLDLGEAVFRAGGVFEGWWLFLKLCKRRKEQFSRCRELGWAGGRILFLISSIGKEQSKGLLFGTRGN